ncbi:MAG TPA: hypothetical protein VKU87_07065 [Thermomicrobiaceae bacterium]|nr:hypothetical protein [Thermomicrobiaceae bacterium]
MATASREATSSSQVQDYAKIVLPSVVAAIVTAVFGIWARDLRLVPGYVPLYDVPGRPFWLAGFLFMVVTGFTFQLLVERRISADEAAVGQSQTPLERTAWMYPCMLIGCILLLLDVYHRPPAIAAVAVLTGLALSVGMLSRRSLTDIDPVRAQRGRGVFTALVHAVAFIGLSMIYINKMRSIFSAPLILVLGAILLLQITEGENVEPLRRYVYALAGGFVLAESTWLLNYWRATGWIGGATLLIFFYIMAGVTAIQIRRGAGRSDVYEYGIIGGIAFAIVAFAVLR